MAPTLRRKTMQLKIKLDNRKRNLITQLGKQGRVLYANIESKVSYEHEKGTDQYYIELINRIDEECKSRGIKSLSGG
jgi:hypothetical protein